MRFYDQGWVQIIIHQRKTRKNFLRLKKLLKMILSPNKHGNIRKVAESSLSAESFNHLKYTICTNRKTTLIFFVDFPSTSAAIQWHLLQAYNFTNISLKILDTTKSTLQLLNFCLREMRKKIIIKRACMQNKLW